MRVFLGSSKESWEELRCIEAWLQEDCGVETLPWDKPGLFLPGEYVLPKIIDLSKDVNGAVLIFGADDEVWYREDAVRQPRDNVLIEYGIFAGVLGQRRSMICRTKRAKMASDLAGVILLDLAPTKEANNRRTIKKWVEHLKGPADEGPRRVIHCDGTASDFRTIDKNHKICTLERELSYSMANVTITICGATVSISSDLVMRDGKKEILQGTYRADGVFEDPNGYMIYTVERPSTGERWRGVSKVRIVAGDDIVGLWMSEGHAEQGKTCLGTFRFRRLDG